MSYFPHLRILQLEKWVAHLSNMLEGVSDPYNILDIHWRGYGPHEQADLFEKKAWAFAFDMNGSPLPSTGALLMDIEEKGFVETLGYRITLEKNKFLSRAIIE